MVSPKKDKIVRARVAFNDFEKWVTVCEGKDISMSEALRIAMSDFTRSHSTPGQRPESS